MPENKNPPNYKLIGVIFLFAVISLAVLVRHIGMSTIRAQTDVNQARQTDERLTPPG